MNGKTIGVIAIGVGAVALVAGAVGTVCHIRKKKKAKLKEQVANILEEIQSDVANAETENNDEGTVTEEVTSEEELVEIKPDTLTEETTVEEVTE